MTTEEMLKELGGHLTTLGYCAVTADSCGPAFDASKAVRFAQWGDYRFYFDPSNLSVRRTLLLSWIDAALDNAIQVPDADLRTMTTYFAGKAKSKLELDAFDVDAAAREIATEVAPKDSVTVWRSAGRNDDCPHWRGSAWREIRLEFGADGGWSAHYYDVTITERGSGTSAQRGEVSPKDAKKTIKKFRDKERIKQ